MPTKPRPLDKVIEAMLTQIPEGHALLAPLNDILSSAQFAAPETMTDFWLLTRDALIRAIPLDETWQGWQETIIDIFIGNLDYKNYLDAEEKKHA